MTSFSRKRDAGKVDSQQTIDEEVAEFLRQRQDRIAVRRARIGEKLAKRNDMQQDVGSVASSLDFLTGDEGTVITGSGTEHTGSGKDKGKGGKGKNKNKSTFGGGDGDASGGIGQDLKRSNVDSLDVQIEESRKQLEQIILDGEALITNVRIAAECREKTRHVKQSETRKERMDRLRQESEECQEMYEGLKPNWNVKGEKILPLDLYAKIKSQQDACEELLQKKDDLIISLQREIEENDFEYETNLEKYQKDVSLLGDRIDDCVDDLQGAFLNELNLIEDYTCRNRESLLEENQREWMDLLDDFETMEEGHLKDRKDDALNKFQILNDLYISVKQECRAMRHKFEDDLRLLLQELEQIKYATQLNMEKLQYNLAIIRKRFKENVEMKNMMKRLLLKFNDRFTNKSRQLKAKMEAGRKEAKKILNDIARLEESLQQFGQKTLHLAVSDYSKYMDLWMVSEELVRERLQKLLDSEKFIFETQLGLEAPMPDLVFMDERPDAVTKYMIKKSAIYSDLQKSMSDSQKKRSKKTSTIGDDMEEDTLDENPTLKTEAASQTCVAPNPSLILLPSESIEFIPGPDPDPAIQRRLMKHVAKVICDESGFIVEDELKKLLDPLVETERNLVNLDALLKALGVNTVSEMQYLAHFLLRRCRVTKGIISRIGSDVSAHLSEMNVSIEGILGKNAVEDLDISGSLTNSKSKTPSPIQTTQEQAPSDVGTESSTKFKECECPTMATDQPLPSDRTSTAPRVIGETLVEILQPQAITRQSDDDCCELIPELAGVDDQQLSLTDFTHAPIHCSPQCCSPAISEETIEEAIFTVDDDQDLEELLDMAEEDEEGEDEEEEEGEEEEGSEEQIPEVESKCSTCGGEKHDHKDCSFFSDAATVLSWVDPDEPPSTYVKQPTHPLPLPPAEEGDEEEEEEQEPGGQPPLMENFDEIIRTDELPEELLEESDAVLELEVLVAPKKMGSHDAPRTSAQLIQDPPQGLRTSQQPPPDIVAVHPQAPRTSEPPPQDIPMPLALLAPPPPQQSADVLEVEDYGEYGRPVRVYDEMDVLDTQRKSLPPPPPMRSLEDDEEDESETESILSLESSSNGSDEFMFIEPDEVIDALTEFCKEYKAKLTVELPTADELIDRKLKTFKYPKPPYVTEYWERPLRMLNAKSEELWNTMQYCFEQYNKALRERNELVEEVTKLYKQNYELSHLMQKHIQSGNKFSPTPSSGRATYQTSNLRYC